MIPIVARVESSLKVSGPGDGARGAIDESRAVQCSAGVVLNGFGVPGHAVSPLAGPSLEKTRGVILEHLRANFRWRELSHVDE